MFLHGFCEFYAFFPHFLSQQQLGINFFGFAGIFYAGLSLFCQLRSRKWCVMMRKWAKIMKNHLFLTFFQFFSHMLSSQLLGTHFFGFLAKFYVGIGCFSDIHAWKWLLSMQIWAKHLKKSHHHHHFQNPASYLSAIPGSHFGNVLWCFLVYLGHIWSQFTPGSTCGSSALPPHNV